MYQALKEQFPKNSAVALGCDLLVAGLAINFQRSNTVMTNLDDRFAAEVEIPQSGGTDDATAITVATAITGMTEEQYNAEIDGLDMEIAESTKEEEAAKRHLSRKSGILYKGLVPSEVIQSHHHRHRTGVRLEQTPDHHNRYADLADSKRSKHDKGSKSDNEDSLDL